MPIFHQHTELTHQWGIWKTSETLEELLGMLPHAEKYRQEVQRFVADSRRLEWLAVRVLLYALLGEEKEILYCPNGRPYLSDGSFSISISHTKGYVAVLLAQSGSTPGIDIEHYSERVSKVAHKYMRADEEPALFQETETWSLLLHWSAKETMFKCMDTPEVDFREHLQIFPFAVDKQGVISVAEYRTAEKRNFLIHYHVFPDFVLTFSL